MQRRLDDQLVEATKGVSLPETLAKIKRLHGEGANINAVGHLNRSALHEAVSKGREPIVQLLLKLGADPNHLDSLKNTPLHQAAWKGHAGITRLLLEHGAKIDAKNKNGHTPITIAQLAAARSGFDLATLELLRTLPKARKNPRRFTPR